LTLPALGVDVAGAGEDACLAAFVVEDFLGVEGFDFVDWAEGFADDAEDLDEEAVDDFDPLPTVGLGVVSLGNKLEDLDNELSGDVVQVFTDDVVEVFVVVGGEILAVGAVDPLDGIFLASGDFVAVAVIVADTVAEVVVVSVVDSLSFL